MGLMELWLWFVRWLCAGFITEAEGAGDGSEPSAEAMCQQRAPLTSVLAYSSLLKQSS